MAHCQDCRFYVPHRNSHTASTGVQGHCIQPRVKIRQPDAPACLYFAPHPTVSDHKQARESGR